MEQNELMHYGVLGMRWGVRRYQNANGSYTKAGLARYRKAEEGYTDAKDIHDATKKMYKASKRGGSVSINGHDVVIGKSVVKQAKAEKKLAKQQMNLAYKQLKKDAKADKGKERYNSGQTITGRGQAIATVGSLGAAGILGAKWLKEMGGPMSSPKTFKAITVASAGVLGASFIADALSEVGNSQLRAYYGHESQKALDEKIFGNGYKSRLKSQ